MATESLATSLRRSMTAAAWINIENIDATMEAKFLPDQDLEDPHRKPNRMHSCNKQGFCTMLISKVKGTLQGPWLGETPYFIHTQDGQLDIVSKAGICSTTKMLLALGVLLVFIFMVMLLLWNYKCIVIDHFCKGSGETLAPIFEDS
ncbi:hypothetical protein FKM82_005287 [Ascaphus truei]